MLIRRPDLDAIARGEITLAFRHWKRPTVRAGGTLRTVIGVLAIDSVEPIEEDAITDSDARSAGFGSAAALIAALDSARGGTLFRIALHLAGPDPRIALRQQSDLSADEAAAIDERLERFDRRSPKGPWTRLLLALIFDKPGERAADLATAAGLEKTWLKTRVRSLKELGLTESLETGYRLSPRGLAYRRASTRDR